ncbi:unnamed protein product [Brachionus calyciflorus]|uniref:Lipoprotein n=1 Tax=Brachionus calyciflorus TaxID=104777 RepID=A0A814JY33_9BILA|nr:unnamed protein product [Brachionus calyciflorus]
MKLILLITLFFMSNTCGYPLSKNDCSTFCPISLVKSVNDPHHIISKNMFSFDNITAIDMEMCVNAQSPISSNFFDLKLSQKEIKIQFKKTECNGLKFFVHVSPFSNDLRELVNFAKLEKHGLNQVSDSFTKKLDKTLNYKVNVLVESPGPDSFLYNLETILIGMKIPNKPESNEEDPPLVSVYLLENNYGIFQLNTPILSNSYLLISEEGKFKNEK